MFGSRLPRKEFGDRKYAKIYVDSGGFLIHNAGPGFEENEKSILTGESYDAVGYARAVRILRGG